MEQVSGFGPDGWKAISGLCAFIAGLIVWIRELNKEISKAKDERIADLQANAALVREDMKNDKKDDKDK